MVVGGDNIEHLIDGFLVGLATASAAAVVAAVVALFRFIRRTDKHRMESIKQDQALGVQLDRRQHHVIRWARAAGRKIGLPFPLPDDDDDYWNDEGLR